MAKAVALVRVTAYGGERCGSCGHLHDPGDAVYTGHVKGKRVFSCPLCLQRAARSHPRQVKPAERGEVLVTPEGGPA